MGDLAPSNLTSQVMGPAIVVCSTQLPGSHVSVLQVAEQLMTLAYDNGINLFDTAEVYAAGK